MFNLFKMGGPLFMGILTAILFILLLFSAFNFILIVRKDFKDINESRKRIGYIKSIGLFGLVTGVFGQMIGLYSAFSAIEKAPDVSPAMMMGGLKVSMLTTLYGMLIFLISYLLWIVIDYLASKQK